MDNVVRIRRGVEPAVPSWAQKALHSELRGREEYDLSEVGLYLAPKKPGQEVYKHLLDTGRIEHCLGTLDAIAIQCLRRSSCDNGFRAESFRQVFGQTTRLFCWRSVVATTEGSLHVLCARYATVQVELDWVPLATMIFGEDDLAGGFFSEK